MYTHKFHQISVAITALGLITLISFIMINDMIRKLSYEQTRAEENSYIVSAQQIGQTDLCQR